MLTGLTLRIMVFMSRSVHHILFLLLNMFVKPCDTGSPFRGVSNQRREPVLRLDLTGCGQFVSFVPSLECKGRYGEGRKTDTAIESEQTEPDRCSAHTGPTLVYKKLTSLEKI